MQNSIYQRMSSKRRLSILIITKNLELNRLNYINRNLIMTYSQCKDYIRSDYFRITGTRSDSLLKLFSLSFRDIGYRFLFWFRLAKCSNVIIFSIARVFYFFIKQRHHIDIARNTNIGYGCNIMHGGPVVINSSANIGDNVNIGQFCTIGSLFCNAATIGNNVYIGPSVCVVENVHIGEGATIGAGAVVVKDVEEGVTVAGNPARVISHKEPGRFVWRKWNKEWNKVKQNKDE